MTPRISHRPARSRGGPACALLVCLSSWTLATGRPGDGIHLDRWTLVPFADVSYTRDSNVYRVPEGGETSDEYFEMEVGLRFLRTAEDEGLSFEGNVFGAQREYRSEVDRNSTSIGEFLSLRQSGGRGWR